EPCSVCGSLHHPNPAQMDTHRISKEKLTDYEEEKNKNHMAHTRLTAEITQTGQLMDEQKALLENIEGEYLDHFKEFSEKEKELQAEIKQSEEKIEELQNYINQESQWRDALEKVQKTKQENQLNLQQEKNNQQVALEKIKELTEEHKILEETLVHTSTKEVEIEMDGKKKQIQTIQNESERIQKALNQKEKEQTQLETSIAMLKEQSKHNKEKIIKQKAIFEDRKSTRLNSSHVSISYADY